MAFDKPFGVPNCHPPRRPAAVTWEKLYCYRFQNHSQTNNGKFYYPVLLNTIKKTSCQATADF
jgi:hypothetical protein